MKQILTARFPGVTRAWHSFGFKFGLLLVVFLALPVLLFISFRDADLERNRILLGSVRDQGRLIAEGVRPILDSGDAIKNPERLNSTLARYATSRIKVRILFRPTANKSEQGFYLVATAPSVSNEYLESERTELSRLGIFERLDESCDWDFQSSTTYTNPKGEDEVLTSITPINLQTGCWVVSTAHRRDNFPITALDEPVWASPQIGAALAIYALMAVVITSLFNGILRGLRRFGTLAHEIRSGADTRGTFESRNQIPELENVAEEFDHMVTALRASSNGIRQAAEENAHALKAPLAVISQSIEPLRRAVSPDDARAKRALDLIDRSVERLDALVSAARRMDEANAQLVDPPRQRIDISPLITRMASAYRLTFADRNLQITEKIEPSLYVLGGEELLETVVENLLDNAASFAPPGSSIAVSLERTADGIRLCVEDRGPGVDPADLDRIFQRYVSIRRSRTSGDGAQQDSGTHFGIGLWIVRRNLEAIGGTILARNRPGGGLSIIVTFPVV